MPGVDGIHDCNTDLKAWLWLQRNAMTKSCTLLLHYALGPGTCTTAAACRSARSEMTWPPTSRRARIRAASLSFVRDGSSIPSCSTPCEAKARQG